jgi:hypothetical protein
VDAAAKIEDDLGAGIEQHQLVNLDDAARECAFIREAITSGGRDYTNPLWNLTTLISTFTEGGRADAHRMGNKHPGYTQESTDEFFDRKDREKVEKGLGWPAAEVNERVAASHQHTSTPAHQQTINHFTPNAYDPSP